MTDEPVDLNFKFVCQHRFADFAGDNPVVRHCHDCRMDVTNLDALTPEAARALIASTATQHVCVSASVRYVNGRSCYELRPPKARIAAAPATMADSGKGQAGDMADIPAPEIADIVTVGIVRVDLRDFD